MKVTEKSRFSSPSRKKPCKYGKVGVSMSGRDENRASAGKFGVSVPCRDENGASAGKFRVFVSGRYGNRASAGKFMVSGSGHDENRASARNPGFPCRDVMGIVQVRDIRGFHVLPHQKPSKCGGIRGVRVQPRWKPSK